MTTYLPRSAWTSTPAAGSPMPTRPVGIAVHWPGSTTAIGDASQASIASRLEGYRQYHVFGHGWLDIAYQVAIDQAGRVWDLRGISRESAANGDQSVNLTYLACLLILGPGETPSDAMRRAFTDWRRDRALVRYPTATRIVGHQDIRPGGGTDCPGPITERLVKASALLLTGTPTPTPVPAQEDDDIMLSEDAQTWLEGRMDAQTQWLAAHIEDTIGRKLAALTPDAIATAVAAKFPAGAAVDVTAVAKAVTDETARRLAS